MATGLTAAQSRANEPAASPHDGGGAAIPALRTRLERGPRRGAASSDVAAGQLAVPRWIERLLRIPLPLKLVGANVVLLAAAFAIGVVLRRQDVATVPLLAMVIAALAAALVVNVALVTLAVRPIGVLGRTVDRIWRGDLDARVPESTLADRDVARVGRMFNILLDGLIADRARTRRLASELIHAEERERAAIARELHDSVAQSLAALTMQLSAAERAIERAVERAAGADVADAIGTARTLSTAVLEEIRLLAHTMHPRVLDDLGLVAALRRLARETTGHSATEVTVEAGAGTDAIGGGAESSVLYRVAQEAVQNALRHAAPATVCIRLTSTGSAAGSRVVLEVADDGRGFDVERAAQAHGGMGIFTMEERVSLVDGTFQIVSHPGRGTTVVASIPLHEPRAISPTEPRQTNA